MQQTSETYKRILAGKHWFENSVTIGDSGRLVTESGDVITFGETPHEVVSILVDTGAPESGFRENALYSVVTNHEFFTDGSPSVGDAVAGYVDIKMLAPYNIPKKARIALYCRVVNGTETSEWVPQGVYYIDTREQTHSGGRDILKIKGYDAMLLANVTYPSDN